MLYVNLSIFNGYAVMGLQKFLNENSKKKINKKSTF